MKVRTSRFRAGDLVEVLSREEILATLDSSGQLDGMPFMPEMLTFCGKTMRVFKSAHKTCDTVFPVRGRSVDQTVHLDTRCDGSAHGGCQAGCLIFWKDAWLKSTNRTESSGERVTSAKGDGCTEAQLWSAAQAPEPDGSTRYICQATQLPYATADLHWWDLWQYVEDYRSGNVGFRRILSGLAYSIYYNLSQSGIGLGRPMRWIYDRMCSLWRGPKWPRTEGKIPINAPTPTGVLGLQAGDLVKIKSHDEILQTIDGNNRNRGLFFDAEMVPYCGGVHRVLKRVTKIIDERTGKMLEMKNPCIILDGVVCQSRYSHCRMFCPRGIYSYWREVWLERVRGQVEAEKNSQPGSEIQGSKDE
jgi:hypothetical protein